MTQKKRAIALGFFDGVHLGHAALIGRTKERAAQLGASPAVLTFDVHPEKLVRGEAVPLINSPAGREYLIRRFFGVQEVLCIHFSEEVMHMSWQAFVLSLRDELNAAHLVVGHDFRFGYRGEGDAAKLHAFCAPLGIGVDVIPPVTLDGRLVSSTYIRELLQAGDMETAGRFLGHPYGLLDTVRHGLKLGRTLGTPTINMQYKEGVMVPRHGVYATKVYIDDTAHIGVTNIGIRPTVAETGRVSVETYILDFDENVYGRLVRLEFYTMLRPEKKFSSVAELQEQIQRDAEAARAYFQKCPV